jgi:hypothetical protein
MSTMKIRYGLTILLLAALGTACEHPLAPEAGPLETTAAFAPQASPHMAASGTFTQTEVTSLEVRFAGPNTILEQTTAGSVSGTLTGSFEDRFTVIIHPNGKFTARGTLTCECTVEGREGVLELVATDIGELASPDVANFAGRAVIKSGTGELAGLRGVIQIDGIVDVPSGLSVYTYSGNIHFQP